MDKGTISEKFVTEVCHLVDRGSQEFSNMAMATLLAACITRLIWEEHTFTTKKEYVGFMKKFFNDGISTAASLLGRYEKTTQ